MRTRVTAVLGIEHPVLSAGMGPLTNVDLVAAVSEAGGLGILGATFLSVEEIHRAVAELRARTAHPFGLNLLLASPPGLFGGPSPLGHPVAWSGHFAGPASAGRLKPGRDAPHGPSAITSEHAAQRSRAPESRYVPRVAPHAACFQLSGFDGSWPLGPAAAD